MKKCLSIFIIVSIIFSTFIIQASAISISEETMISTQNQIISLDTQTGEFSYSLISENRSSAVLNTEELSCPAVPPLSTYINSEPIDNPISPNAIIGNDDGRREASPYIWGIAYLISYWKDGSTSAGTAFVFANSALLTVGHNIYTSSKGWVDYVTVAPSRCDQSVPFGILQSTTIHTNSAWVNNADTNYDYAVVEVGSNIGQQTGLFGFTASYSVGTPITVNGYPAYHNAKQYFMEGTIHSITDYHVRYTIDVTEGQSGSPVYNDSFQAVAIHSSSYNNLNYGVKITSSLVSWLLTFRQ